MGFHAFALDRIEPEHEHLVGQRVALLALAHKRGFAVPPGFVIHKRSFGDLVRDTSLKLELPAVLKRLHSPKANLEEISRGTQALIRSVTIPQGISLDVMANCKQMGIGTRTAGRSATLRACPTDDRLSSAPLERSVAITRLSDIEGVVKSCWGSVFSAENLERIRSLGMLLDEAAPSVLITVTVAAETSGIMFSESPGNPADVLIEAVWGFHEALSEGEFVPSRYRVVREQLGEVRGEERAQDWEYAQGAQGVLVRREVSAERRARPKLQRLQVEELARAALELERMIGSPVAVEWAIQGGVVFVLQIVPLAPTAPIRGEEAAAEEYIASARAREEELTRVEFDEPPEAPPPRAVVRAEVSPPRRSPVRDPAKVVAPAPASRAPPPPPAATQDPPAAPVPPKVLGRTGRLLPVIRTSLFVGLPGPTEPAATAHIPHAGFVVDLPVWRKGRGNRAELVTGLAGAATSVFPRPLLVELTDLSPGQYESMREQAAVGRDDALEEVLGGVLDELALLDEVSELTGATNIHVVAPFIKAPEDLAVMRRALEYAPTSQGPRTRHTLVFAEVRAPSGLRGVGSLGPAPDGLILRAGRFYKSLLQQGQDGAPASGSRSEEANGFRTGEFARVLLDVTRALERAGGTVLVKLDDESDLDTLSFYLGIGVDGFIAPLEGAEACARELHTIERGGAARAR